MAQTNFFDILRRGQRQNISLIVPAVAAAEGIAFQESATAGTAELADGTKRAFFVTRPVVAAITDLTNTIAELTGQGAQPVENPFIGGYEAGLEDADEFICGGPDYRYSGTGAITAATALKTKAGFKDGKVRAPQSGEYAEFMLVEKPVLDGLQCYRFERIEGFTV